MSSPLRSVRVLFIVLVLIPVLGISSAALADIKADIGISSGYSGNLLNDSSSTDDSYSTARLALNIYPASFLEIAIQNDYTYYSKIHDLSNFSGGGTIRIIPTPQDFFVSVVASLNFNSRVYRDDFSQFNNDDYTWSLAASHLLLRRFQLRSGVAYNRLKYTNFDGADKSTFKLFGGLNFSFWGSNTLDLETGYAYMDYRRFRDTVRFVNPSPFTPLDSLLTDDRLNSLYISPRFSRSLGSKTGINISYTFRNFSNFDRVVVYGFTTGYLSPWASVYDGNSVSANIKTFLVPGFILTTGAGYWDKVFFKTLEQGIYLIRRAKSRHDFQHRIYAGIQKPIILKSGTRFEPFIQYDYSKTKSTYKLYCYSSSSISAGLNISF